MADRRCSDCGHGKSSHKWEDGFYDVRGRHGDCDWVGCPCDRFRPSLTPVQEDDKHSYEDVRS